MTEYAIGGICLFGALGLLYLKYRIIFKGERHRAQIVDIGAINCGYTTRGIAVKKHAYVVEILGERYFTSHGCLFTALGKRKIGKEITVYRNERYGKEVVKPTDLRVEVMAALLVVFAVLVIRS